MLQFVDSLEPRRLMAAGSIDPSFTRVAASVPVVRTDLTDARPIDVGYDIDGSAFMLVSVDRDGTRLPALMRVNPDGSRDTSFGTFGLTVLELGLYSHDAKAIAVDGAGRVNILATVKTTEGSNPMVMVTQINRRGQLIARFGQRGNAFPRFGETSTAADIAVDPLTNNILVLDTTSAVARLSVSGRYDTTFGSRSVVRTLAGAGAAGIGESIVTDGTKLLVGTTINTRRGSTDWCVTHLRMSNGSYDLSFGRRGFASIDVAGGKDKLDSITIDGDGKTVIVGKRAYTGSLYRAMIAIGRLARDGSFDTTFSENGVADGEEIGTGDFNPLGTNFSHIPFGIATTDRSYRIMTDHSLIDLSLDGASFAQLVEWRSGMQAFAQRGERSIVARHLEGNSDSFGPAPGWEPGIATLEEISNTDTANWSTALGLVRAVDTVAVGADGALFHSEISRNTGERFAVRSHGTGETLGKFPMSRGQDQSYGGPISVYNGRGLPRSDGGFDLVYQFQDPMDGDGGSYSMWSLDPQEGVKTGFATSDATWQEAFADLPFDQFCIVTEYSFSSSWDTAVFERDRVIRSASFSYYDYEAEPPQFDWPPLISVPILGSTDVYVKIQIPINPEPGTEVSYQVARLDADDNYVSSFAGTGYMTIADFTPLYGQYDGRLLYSLTGTTGLRRLNADGTTDTTFGSKGMMAQGFDHFDIDSKGRLIAWRVLTGGASDGDVQIMRFSQNGKVDTTFGGGDGLIIVDAKLPSTATANVIIDTNDNLVVTAYRQSASAISWSATRILGD